MGYLEQLMSKTSQISETTRSICTIYDVEKYVTGFHSWSHHRPVPARPIWDTAMFESSRLAGASFFLALNGFYEEACSVLRGVLDGFLTRLYWDTLDKNAELNTKKYWDWESGAAKKYPNLETGVWPTLLKEERIAGYDKQYGIKEKIDNELRLLSKFVHGRPPSRHYEGASRSSLGIVGFKEKHFREWHQHLRAVYRLVSILSVLQYPELLESKYGQEFVALEPDAANFG